MWNWRVTKRWRRNKGRHRRKSRNTKDKSPRIDGMGRDEKTQEEINMSGAAQNEKRVKGRGQRDGQLRVMAYISLSLFNESRIDRAITPDTRTQFLCRGWLDWTALLKRTCLKLHFKKKHNPTLYALFVRFTEKYLKLVSELEMIQETEQRRLE